MSPHSRTRPLLQFSLQGLLVVMTVIAIGLALMAAVYHDKATWRDVGRLLTTYCFFIFAVGPWFAYLTAECLPIAAPQLRTALANMILLALFVITLKLAEATLPGPIVIVVAVAALVLWTPQYMIFFIWKMGD